MGKLDDELVVKKLHPCRLSSLTKARSSDDCRFAPGCFNKMHGEPYVVLGCPLCVVAGS